ncbi:DUF3048 domain-containing protein [Nocardioides coralli]|uniref:DUF3048 domain-containing protein n=1 Tax=Nocardioides coralli TaxID=2872154 RepID=UPI001CA3DA68|nr:DUF3048 domain-containing protein [Nocardioides coralli]QZY28395.1 DUF3048 domain-containing protein [Nocardioides coralli]
MRRSPLTMTAALLAGSLLLAACGGDEAEPESESTPGQEVAEGSTLGQTWPLTGLDVEGEDSSLRTHPVMVAKIDNSSSSAPQVGLGAADLVVEELVEGGMTRLAVFYYSEIPGTVGPIRSMRSSDIGIVSPVDAEVVTSGAAPITVNRLRNAGVRFYGEGSPGFTRAGDRSAPYNLMADLGKLVDSRKETPEGRPDDYLPWGEAEDLPKGKKARTIAAAFGSHTTTWSYRNGGYVNQNSYAAGGDEFPTDTVLVLRVRVGDAGYRDPAGNPVPETKLEGKGQALLFHGGKVVTGTWSKKGLDAPLSLSTKKGKLEVPAGHTWIELVPQQSGNVTFK